MKRKDSKGRNLKTGEGQRQNGLYYFQCTDKYGNRTSITSWKLVPTDPLPHGKRPCVSLREQEEFLAKKVRDGLDLSTKCTVTQAAMQYQESRVGLKPGSMNAIRKFIKVLGRYRISVMQINDVEIKDVKDFCRQMYKDGYAVTTIQNYKGKLSSVFEYAREELHLTTLNPAKFKLSEVIKEPPNKRCSLTEQEKADFLQFLKSDYVSSKHYDEINLLLGTGLRISEFVGLTVNNIDLEHHCIIVDHQLQEINNSREWTTPKSAAGNRVVFVSNDVEDSAKRLIDAAVSKRSNFSCNGVSDFIILDQYGNPRKTGVFRRILKDIVGRYEKTTGASMPNIIPHVLRHTYCTTQANSGIDLVALQYMMGHTDIATTSRYLHASQEHARTEAERVYRQQTK